MYEIRILMNLVLVVLIKVCLCDETVEVTLEQGIVLGKIEKTLFKKQNYSAFKGIPYAAPPVGKLRFKPPTPHEGWHDTLEAFDNTPTCMQFSARMRNNEPFGISGSEDCLFISVFTPSLQGTAPVVVFDYNDNFKTGFNGTDVYSPDNFLEEDVIIVTISHRLGIFGYLTTEDEVIPSNNGLRDFIYGLEWIKNNIKRFGGNPEKVTLMGSCGGATLVNMLLYSEKAKGLFSKAIIQSGNAFETAYFYEHSKKKAFQLGEEYDVKTNDSAVLLEALQVPNPEDLLNKVIKVLAKDAPSSEYRTTSQPFLPVAEHNYHDAVLTSLPENAKIVSDVPVMIGFNSREGLDFISHFLSDPRLLMYSTQDKILQFPIRTGYRFENDTNIFKRATQEVIDFYLESGVLDYDSLLEYSVYAGDILLGYPLNQAAKTLASDLKSPVYYYMFDFRGQLNENMQYLTRHAKYNLQHWGATVGDELCYLHVCSRIKIDYLTLSKMVSEQKERKVLKKMVRMWTNFARTGNPTPTKDATLNDFVWNPISKDSEDLAYLHITKSLRMENNPLGQRGKFWDKFLAKYAEMAVNGVVKEEEAHDEL